MRVTARMHPTASPRQPGRPGQSLPRNPRAGRRSQTLRRPSPAPLPRSSPHPAQDPPPPLQPAPSSAGTPLRLAPVLAGLRWGWGRGGLPRGCSRNAREHAPTFPVLTDGVPEAHTGCGEAAEARAAGQGGSSALRSPPSPGAQRRTPAHDTHRCQSAPAAEQPLRTAAPAGLRAAPACPLGDPSGLAAAGPTPLAWPGARGWRLSARRARARPRSGSRQSRRPGAKAVQPLAARGAGPRDVAAAPFARIRPWCREIESRGRSQGWVGGKASSPLGHREARRAPPEPGRGDVVPRGDLSRDRPSRRPSREERWRGCGALAGGACSRAQTAHAAALVPNHNFTVSKKLSNLCTKSGGASPRVQSNKLTFSI